MSTYCVNSVGHTEDALVVRAVTYDIRLTQVTFSSNATSGYWCHIGRYDSSTVTGTAGTITPTRQGAPAATATAVHTNNTPSGTWHNFAVFWLPTGTGQTEYANFFAPGSGNSFAPPLTVTASPGSLLYVDILGSNIVGTIFFEEIRLPGSY